MATATKKRTVPASTKGMNPVYCAGENCGKFLCYEKIETGIVHIKCHRCKTVNQVSQVPGDVTAPQSMRKAKCSNCGRFLYDEALIKGDVRVKCRGCGTWNTLEINNGIS